MSKQPHFLVHNSKDSVGVAVVEGIEAGMDLDGWVMDTDATLVVKSLDAIPIGHKIALADIAEGDSITKYGHDIGLVVAPIRKGGHVHVHNLKTRRW